MNAQEARHKALMANYDEGMEWRYIERLVDESAAICALECVAVVPGWYIEAAVEKLKALNFDTRCERLSGCGGYYQLRISWRNAI